MVRRGTSTSVSGYAVSILQAEKQVQRKATTCPKSSAGLDPGRAGRTRERIVGEEDAEWGVGGKLCGLTG